MAANTSTITTLVNNVTFQLRGSDTLNLTTMDVDTGDFEYIGDADGAEDTFTIKDFGTTDYFNLRIASTDAADIYSSAAAKSISGTLTVTAGTLNMNGQTTTVTVLATVSGGTLQTSTATTTLNGGLTVSGGTLTGSSGAVNVTGNLIYSSGTLTAPSAMSLTGDLTFTGSTFDPGTGTLTLNGTTDQTITQGGESFYNLTLNNTGADGSDDIIISGALDIDNTLTVTNGDLDIDLNDPDVTIA